MLFSHAAATPGLRILTRTSAVDFGQGEHGVLAFATNLDANESFEIFARYLVGCDGAHSGVRRRVGLVLSGDAAML